MNARQVYQLTVQTLEARFSLDMRRYRLWAQEQGLLREPLPSLETLQGLLESTMIGPPPPQNLSSVAPYRETVEQLRKEGVQDRRHSPTAARARLRRQLCVGAPSGAQGYVIMDSSLLDQPSFDQLHHRSNLWSFVKWVWLYSPQQGPRQMQHHLLPLARWRLWLWEMVKQRLGLVMEIIVPLPQVAGY